MKNNASGNEVLASVFTPNHAPVIRDFLERIESLMKENLEVSDYAVRTDQWTKAEEEAATFRTGKVKIRIIMESSK